MAGHRIYTVSFASVYPMYITKAEKKGRTKTDVDEIIGWLTGYSQEELEAQLERQTDFEIWSAQRQPSGSHPRKDGQGRFQHLGEQPFVYPIRG